MNGLHKIMSIEDQLNSLKEVFNLFDDPKDKFVQLMDMAKESSGLGHEEKTDSNKINGCTSQAWIVGIPNDDGTYKFKIDSDALIVKGLLRILEKVFSDHPVKEILKIHGSHLIIGWVVLCGIIYREQIERIFYMI